MTGERERAHGRPAQRLKKYPADEGVQHEHNRYYARFRGDRDSHERVTTSAFKLDWRNGVRTRWYAA